MTRSSVACARGERSLTSSSSKVPRSASSNRPVRSATAPVNAPRAWPNSSASRRSSPRAAQFTAQNRCPRRGPVSWIRRATSSFPVPLSPSIRTAKGARAACATSARTASMAALSPSSPAAARCRAGSMATRASSDARTAGAQAVAAADSSAAARGASTRASAGHRHVTAPMVRPPYRTATALSMPLPPSCGATAAPLASARAAPPSRQGHDGPTRARIVSASPSRATIAAPRALSRSTRRRHVTASAASGASAS